MTDALDRVAGALERIAAAVEDWPGEMLVSGKAVPPDDVLNLPVKGRLPGYALGAVARALWGKQRDALTLRELTTLSEGDLLAVPKVGVVSVRQIKDLLASHGLSSRGDSHPAPAPPATLTSPHG